jgi:hypothetical protein
LLFNSIINRIDNNTVFYFQNLFETTHNILINELKHRKVDLRQFLKEKVGFEENIGEDASENDTQRLLECIGMITNASCCQLLFLFSSDCKGTVSIGLLALPSVDVRLFEPLEDVKVNKQMLADANKLMADARFKGMKAVASLAGHRHTNYVLSVAFSPDGATYCFGKWGQVGEGKVCVWQEGGCRWLANWVR